MCGPFAPPSGQVLNCNKKISRLLSTCEMEHFHHPESFFLYLYFSKKASILRGGGGESSYFIYSVKIS